MQNTEITVKVYGHIKENLDIGGDGNIVVKIGKDATIGYIINYLGIDAGIKPIVMVNDRINYNRDYPVKESDEISILPLSVGS